MTAGDWSLVAADKNQQFLETIVLFHIECGQHRRQGDQEHPNPCKLQAGCFNTQNRSLVVPLSPGLGTLILAT